MSQTCILFSPEGAHVQVSSDPRGLNYKICKKLTVLLQKQSVVSAFHMERHKVTTELKAYLWHFLNTWVHTGLILKENIFQCLYGPEPMELMFGYSWTTMLTSYTAEAVFCLCYYSDFGDSGLR